MATWNCFSPRQTEVPSRPYLTLVHCRGLKRRKKSEKRDKLDFASMSPYDDMSSTPDNNDNTRKSFKQRKTFATRREEVENIRAKFPTKIPVIVERFYKETSLPVLDKTKFLVPQELTMSQFVTIIRNRMQLTSSQAFYLMVNNKSMASMSKTLSEVYRENKDPDGFLYVTYASQEVFGAL